MKDYSVVVFRDDIEADSNGNKFILDNIEIPKEVLVLLNFSEPVGKAKLKREGNEIKAEFTISVNKNFKGFYPSISIKADRTHKEGNITVIDKARIMSICIHSNPNVDKTIQPIGEIEYIL